MGVHDIIQELVKEALESLAMRGFDHPFEMEAMWDETKFKHTSWNDLHGCLVKAKNTTGAIASESVWYPKNWWDREQRERAAKESK